MPLREIRKRFTFSEMALMAWRSKEMSVNMSEGHKRPPRESPDIKEDNKELPDYGLQHKKPIRHAHVIEHEDSYELEKDVNNGVAIPKSFFNEEGELDLSRTTGPNALKYMNALGFNIPIVFR